MGSVNCIAEDPKVCFIVAAMFENVVAVVTSLSEVEWAAGPFDTGSSRHLQDKCASRAQILSRKCGDSTGVS